MFIGNVAIKTGLALAPMAGVTDAAFRIMCARMGAVYAVTEMISAKAICYQDGKSRRLASLSEDARPIGLQIFGSDPVTMGEAASKLWEYEKPDIIDINMGCPVSKVVRSGDGSALMREPEKAAKIVEAVVRSVPCPVTVKFRKGFDGGSVNAVEFGLMCQQSGASAVTVHGRTRVQMYAGKADWDIIGAVKAALSIPVIANGDVFTWEDAAHILSYTGADMAMAGRGAMGNPWLFRDSAAALAGQPVPAPPTWQERLDMAVAQSELAARLKGEKIACLEARHHLAWYIRGMRYAGYYRERVMGVETLKDIYNVCRDIADSIRDDERRRGNDG